MRFAAIIAAAAALWAGPALAYQWFPLYKDTTLKQTHQRWEFSIIGELPPDFYLNYPVFNQLEQYTTIWNGGSSYEQVYNNDMSTHVVSRNVVESSRTHWIIDYFWEPNTQFDVCGTSQAVIGRACAVHTELWANAGWYPVLGAEGTEVDFYWDFKMKSIGAPTFSVPEPSTWALMILGIGAVGVGLRRRRHGSTVRVMVDPPALMV